MTITGIHPSAKVADHNIDHAPVCRYDYENQAWIKDGVYVRCGHHEAMICGCFGREHEGESAE